MQKAGTYMFYNAKNGKLKIDDTEMEYICFGKGEKTLIMIPGLGDGLKTVKGLAIPFAMLYKQYAHEYTVYVFSRKNKLKEGFTTREMASDLVTAMDILGIKKASIIGISQGGMIAQYIAIDAPNKVEKLVLAVTLCKPNETSQRVIGDWIKMAESNEYGNIFIDIAEKSYTEKRLRMYRLCYPLLTRYTKPKDLTRFIIQAYACITHHAKAELDKIKCPTLVIGGDEDQIVGSESSSELAEGIKNSQLILYSGMSHGLYEEASDFNTHVLTFLKANV